MISSDIGVVDGVRALFHQPHPSKEVKKSVKAIHTFLENANIP